MVQMGAVLLQACEPVAVIPPLKKPAPSSRAGVLPNRGGDAFDAAAGERTGRMRPASSRWDLSPQDASVGA